MNTDRAVGYDGCAGSWFFVGRRRSLAPKSEVCRLKVKMSGEEYPWDPLDRAGQRCFFVGGWVEKRAMSRCSALLSSPLPHRPV